MNFSGNDLKKNFWHMFITHSYKIVLHNIIDILERYKD